MEMFQTKTLVFVLYYLIHYCNSFIIPNELPSLLSIIYSNIPPVKVGQGTRAPAPRKVRTCLMTTQLYIASNFNIYSRDSKLRPWKGQQGFDTRFGLGFRLGPHADYQTLIEIGPQTNTNPLSPNGTVSKRQSNTLRAIHRLSEKPKSIEGKPDKKESNKGKKVEKTMVGKIEFKKVPGIDDANTKTKPIKNEKIDDTNSKTDAVKNEKITPNSSPTKFVLL